MTRTDMPLWLRESAPSNVSPHQATLDAREKIEAALTALRALPPVGLIECRGMIAHLERRRDDIDARLGLAAA